MSRGRTIVGMRADRPRRLIRGKLQASAANFPKRVPLPALFPLDVIALENMPAPISRGRCNVHTGRCRMVDQYCSKQNDAVTRVIDYQGLFVGSVGITPQSVWRENEAFLKKTNLSECTGRSGRIRRRKQHDLQSGDAFLTFSNSVSAVVRL
jgi:hypothetical protein